MKAPVHFDIDAARQHILERQQAAIDEARLTAGADLALIHWQEQLSKARAEFAVQGMAARNTNDVRSYVRASGLAIGQIIWMMIANCPDQFLEDFTDGIERGQSMHNRRDTTGGRFAIHGTEGGNA